MIHLRLEAWGEWSKSNPELREYPEVSLLGKIGDCGPDGAVATGSRPPVSMPEAIEVTERAVNRLGEIDKKVIKAYYMGWAPVEMLARRCRMRDKEFQNVLRRARFRIAVYVDALEQVAA